MTNRTLELCIRWSIALLLCAWNAGFPCASPGQELSQLGRVDFRSQVLPIFIDRCAQCHGTDNVQGNLNLLSPAAIEEGGFSGLAIVGESIDQSELLLRITSDDDDYRMPKSEDALSSAEIDTIRQWVEQGGSFEAPPRQEPSPTFIDRLGSVWSTAESALARRPYRYAAIFIGPWLAYLLVLLLKLVAQRRRKTIPTNDSSGNPSLGLKAFLATTLVLALAAAFGFQHGLLQEKTAEMVSLKNQLRIESKDIVQDFNTPPVAPHPMHPPRLGGIYYRGNDERNDKLFNNGFYQTAQLNLQLINDQGIPLRIGDALDNGGLSIRLGVKRAPNAAQGMFDQRTMSTTFVSTSFQGTDAATDRQLLKPIDSGEEWAVEFPIPKKSWTDKETPGDSSETGLHGVLYVYYGPLERNRIHYAIHYDLQIDEGMIAGGSELWMGSTYNLNGRVLLPGKDAILLDRWFDFRPIPEIPK